MFRRIVGFMRMKPVASQEAEPQPGNPSNGDLLDLTEKQVEQLFCNERARRRLNMSENELARDDALHKLESFQLFVTGESSCTRSEVFYAYFHVENSFHLLQHEEFIDIFGIEDYSNDDSQLQRQPQIVKVDDPESPSVAIQRRVLAHTDGSVYGIYYQGIRFSEQEDVV